MTVLLVSSLNHSACSLHMEKEASIYWKLTTIPSPRFIQVDSCSDEFALVPLLILSYQVVSLDCSFFSKWTMFTNIQISSPQTQLSYLWKTHSLQAWIEQSNYSSEIRCRYYAQLKVTAIIYGVTPSSCEIRAYTIVRHSRIHHSIFSRSMRDAINTRRDACGGRVQFANSNRNMSSDLFNGYMLISSLWHLFKRAIVS